MQKVAILAIAILGAMAPAFGSQDLVESSLIAQASKKDTSGNDSWIPVGFNDKRIAVLWVQHKSYEPLNVNSFRMSAKVTNDNGIQVVGRLDFNCKNKDYYFRPNGVLFQGAPWAAIPQGSGLEGLAKQYCKNTDAKADWGYKPESSYIWDYEPIAEDPANAKGEWILVTDNEELEAYYNSAVIKSGDVVTYAYYLRPKKGDRSAAQPFDDSKYFWIRNSCRENLSSILQKPDVSVAGVWFPPTAGRPGGASMVVRSKFCN